MIAVTSSDDRLRAWYLVRAARRRMFEQFAGAPGLPRPVAELVPFQDGEHRGDDDHDVKGDEPERLQPVADGVRRPARGIEDRQPEQHEQPGHEVEERGDGQHELVGRQQHRADQRLLRKIALGHQHRVAPPGEDDFELRLTKRPAQLGFLVLDLRADVFRQFGEDVLLLFPRQPELNRLQVTIEKLHVVSPSKSPSVTYRCSSTPPEAASASPRRRPTAGRSACCACLPRATR